MHHRSSSPLQPSPGSSPTLFWSRPLPGNAPSTEAVGLAVTPAPSEWSPFPRRGLVAGAGQMPQPHFGSRSATAAGQKKTFIQLHNPVTHQGLSEARHSHVLQLRNNGLSEVIYFYRFSASSEKIQFKSLQVSKASPWQITSETCLDKLFYLSRRLDGDLLLQIPSKREYQMCIPKPARWGAGNTTHGRGGCCSTRTQTPLWATAPFFTYLEEAPSCRSCTRAERDPGSGLSGRQPVSWEKTKLFSLAEKKSPKLSCLQVLSTTITFRLSQSAHDSKRPAYQWGQQREINKHLGLY